MQTAAGGIERKLANGDAHPARALVAKTEDALAIGHHNGLDLVETRIGQNALDTLDVRNAEKQSARLAEGMTEFLAAETHCRRVDNRQHLGHIARKQSVEQHLVAVLQAAQEDIARKIVRQPPERLPATVNLLLERRDVGRQQPVQLEPVALLLGERGSLVQERIVEKVVAEYGSFDERLFGQALLSTQHYARPPDVT